jgi:PAS domain S-box-containing protein
LSSSTSNPITVLIVDDEENIREMLRSFLEELGMTVLSADSAETVLARHDLGQVDVALLDIRLPGRVDGHALQQELNQRFPDMAKILMSGYADLDDVIAAFSDQAFSFVKKPFASLKEIGVLIERAAMNKRLEIQNRAYAERLRDANRNLTDRVTKTTAEASRYQEILAHLYLVSSQLGRIEQTDRLLDFICQAVVEAGAFRRAAVLLADERFLVGSAGAWEEGGTGETLRDALRGLRGQPLRPYEFRRQEQRIGTAVYARTGTAQGVATQRDQDSSEQIFVPLLRRDGSVFGFLSLEPPARGEPPSVEVVRLLEILLTNATLYLEAHALSDELKKRANELELRVHERTQQLRLSEERFSRLVNSTTDIVYVADENDRVVFLNEAFARTLGYVRENYVGRMFARMMEDIATDNPMNRRALQELAAQNEEHGIHQVEVVSRQGDKRTLEINRTLILQGGVARGSQGIIRDVTEHRVLLQQLVSAERLAATGRLATGIAHEINNPLQAMASQLSAVQGKLRDQKNPAENIELIREGIERIRQIVRSMLDLHRTSGTAQGTVNLRETAEKVASLVSQQLKEQGIRLTLELQADLPLVSGSPQELQQVVLNLVLNSIEAMPRGGELTIRASSTPKTVEVQVCDTGVGIAPEHLSQIFEPFFTFRSSGGGTGLGLYLSRNIVEAHQGRITVQSEKGKGTIFTITFPRS